MQNPALHQRASGSWENIWEEQLSAELTDTEWADVGKKGDGNESR